MFSKCLTNYCPLWQFLFISFLVLCNTKHTSSSSMNTDDKWCQQESHPPITCVHLFGVVLFQKISIFPPQMVFYFEAPTPLWKFQFSFILSLKIFGVKHPPPSPSKFPVTLFGRVWIFSGTTHLYLMYVHQGCRFLPNDCFVSQNILQRERILYSCLI